ncbi:MAG: CoA pyrophosphatase [Deltaproteobacteria bacterium]|nr:CoA pyrophosphatase [Deltaproteobacteria bacterium]PWB66787.1 MAG: CoA pyrophosphatase [Deltaproteobacteria bacterium]
MQRLVLGAGFFPRLQGLLKPVSRRFPPPEGMRSAGVLVPLRVRGDAVTVVLARRTEQVPHHKGQICFPGGSRDSGDADLLETALREAEEELGILRGDAQILGTMDPVITVTGFCIQPYVAIISANAEFRLDAFEMAEAFEAPLPLFTEFERYRYAESTFRGERNRLYFFDYGPYTIWGATATILHRLAELVVECASTDG